MLPMTKTLDVVCAIPAGMIEFQRNVIQESTRFIARQIAILEASCSNASAIEYLWCISP